MTGTDQMDRAAAELDSCVGDLVALLRARGLTAGSILAVRRAEGARSAYRAAEVALRTETRPDKGAIATRVWVIPYQGGLACHDGRPGTVAAYPDDPDVLRGRFRRDQDGTPQACVDAGTGRGWEWVRMRRAVLTLEEGC